jgi:hypothetical protein
VVEDQVKERKLLTSVLPLPFPSPQTAMSQSLRQYVADQLLDVLSMSEDTVVDCALAIGTWLRALSPPYSAAASLR